jgi:hypothetical protein
LEECRTADAPWSIKAYVWAFAATPGPFSIAPLDDEGQEFAKLTSATFAGLTDYVSVLRDAQKWVQMITGVMKIKQDRQHRRCIRGWDYKEVSSLGTSNLGQVRPGYRGRERRSEAEDHF